MRIVEVIGRGISRLEAGGAPGLASRRTVAATARGPEVDARDAASSASLDGATVALSPQALEVSRQLAAAGADPAAVVWAPAQADPAPDPASQAPASTTGADSQPDATVPAQPTPEPVTDGAPFNAANVSYELGADGFIYAVTSSPSESTPAPEQASPSQPVSTAPGADVATGTRVRQALAQLKANRA
jgi:hypothetical protein